MSSNPNVITSNNLYGITFVCQNFISSKVVISLDGTLQSIKVHMRSSFVMCYRNAGNIYLPIATSRKCRLLNPSIISAILESEFAVRNVNALSIQQLYRIKLHILPNTAHVLVNFSAKYQIKYDPGHFCLISKSVLRTSILIILKSVGSCPRLRELKFTNTVTLI